MSLDFHCTCVVVYGYDPSELLVFVVGRKTKIMLGIDVSQVMIRSKDTSILVGVVSSDLNQFEF